MSQKLSLNFNVQEKGSYNKGKNVNKYPLKLFQDVKV